jgi:hypothetical protein
MASRSNDGCRRDAISPAEYRMHGMLIASFILSRVLPSDRWLSSNKEIN